jgi:hypothetical protein
MKKMMALLILAAVGLVACSSSSPNSYHQDESQRPLVDDKYSLQADRQAMESLRSQVPADKKRENDELALVLGMMSEVKKKPMDIRGQFDSILRKKRALFDKDISKEREVFTKEERKKREAFLKAQKDQRDFFGKEKHTREERAEFFHDQDAKRSEFFADERDKRGDFESDVRERRKNFEDYVREKQNDFNQEHRAYTKRYEDMIKEQEKAKKAAAAGSASDNSYVQPGQSSASASSPAVMPTPAVNTEAQDLENELEKLKGKSGSHLESGE